MRDEQPHRLLRGARHDAADVLERRRTPEFVRDARRAEGLERERLKVHSETLCVALDSTA